MERLLSLPKLRNLDKYGVITDVDPFDLPLGAWSMALNVRFEDGRINSAPVWRGVASLTNVNPRFVYVANAADSTTNIYIGSLDGTIANWTPSTTTDATMSGYTPASVEAQWTGAILAGVVYMNREDRQPWALLPSASKFTLMSNMDSAWTAKIIRAYDSALIAFNVTKAGQRYPTMVKASDLVNNPNTEPPSWDATVTTNNAVENTLTEMNGEIVEVQPLGSSLIIYSNQETWLMAADGSTDVYSFRKLPFNAGAIGTNCVAPVDAVHYVFGADDLWIHDGTTPVSISDEKVRKFVFGSMNAKQASRFFTLYDPAKKTVSFHFVSGDAYVYFNKSGCNRAAVYHTVSKVWTFDDTPLVFSAGYAKVTLDELTWSNDGATWAQAGGSWQDLEDGFKRVPIYVGEGDTVSGLTASVYGRDLYGTGSVLSSPVDPIATRPGLLLRDGIDLDEMDAELRGYKLVNTIYPQGRLDPSAMPVEFSVGTTDFPSVPPVMTATQTYDAASNYWCDFGVAGRFLSIRMDYPDYKTMSLSGFDIDLDTLGSR